jgi:hypothetical protein
MLRLYLLCSLKYLNLSCIRVVKSGGGPAVVAW